MQTEANLLQPLAPVREIPSDLPELQVGQSFLARIQEGLPENTYKALVAGKMLTLQLPEGAKPGDTLELVLIDRTARVLIARRLETPAEAGAAAEPYPYANVSRAGQMISRLLLPEGEAPQPAPLTRGQPLLGQPPAQGAELAPVLAKAVGQSGLFYEAHQAQWVAGRRPLEALQAEPQGRLPTVAAQAANPNAANTAGTQAAAATPPAPSPPLAAAPAERPAEAASQASQLAQAVPDSLRPLVQQQLDAIASQRLAWHGEVWPGQTMDWEIEEERPRERDAEGGEETASRWNTTLRLSLPRLGTVDAMLQLSTAGLRVRLATDDPATLADLRGSSGQLAAMLADAGLSVQAIEIRREEGE
jgi:hypothetical protein